jgi:hypothetical protein
MDRTESFGTRYDEFTVKFGVRSFTGGKATKEVGMHGFNSLTVAAVVAASMAISAQADSSNTDAVLAKATQAMGGKEAIEKIQSVRSVMATSTGGMTIEIESFWMRDGGRIVRTKMPMGQMEMGTDGKTSWKKGPMGSGPLTKDDTSQLNNQAGMIIHMLDPAFAAKEQMAELTVMDVETFKDKECHRVHYKNKEGKEGDLFFEVITGLPIGSRNVEKQGDREMESTVLFSDWEDTDGIKVFRTMTIESPDRPGPMMTVQVKSIEFNGLDSATFTPPSDASPAPSSKPESAPKPAADAKEISLDDLTAEQREQATKMLDGLKKSGNVAVMKQTLSSLEPSLGYMPANQKATMQYVVQELKKEIARLGG